MIINGKVLAERILNHLKEEIAHGVKKGAIPPRLVIFSIKPAPETEAFMKNKKKSAESIGAAFELILYKQSPRFESFANNISSFAHRSDVHGVIIQEPLPSSMQTVTLFDYIPTVKEIEGFKKKSPYDYPIGLATLTAIKQSYLQGDPDRIENILVDLDKDTAFFKNVLKRKKVVLIGRGKTGGTPIGRLLQKIKIGYINLNSKTTGNSTMFLQQADVIISAVGKKVIEPDMLKPGVALYSVGIHRIDGVWQGDYDEKEIAPKALVYTPTPGGIGPLNVAYLLYNLVKAWKVQNDLS